MQLNRSQNYKRRLKILSHNIEYKTPMKIKKPVDDALQAKASALLTNAFPNSKYENNLVEDLRENSREIHEWVAIHRNRVVAYIAFTVAYNDDDVPCGLHLAPLAVHPEYQNQGFGTELTLFALRQKEIADKTIFVLGKPGYYNRFGFSGCKSPYCEFTKNNKNFMVLRPGSSDTEFTIGYEPEF